MADHRMIFSAPMVRALRDGRKTQTRRILNPRKGLTVDDLIGKGEPFTEPVSGYRCARHQVQEPRIRPGDRVWVLESWRTWADLDPLMPSQLPVGCDIQYAADDPLSPWISRLRSPIHMPRWAIRITLTVTEVRVQRVQDISEVDAVAEGIGRLIGSKGPNHFTREVCGKWSGSFNAPTAQEVYADLWNTIHGPGAWERNDWVAAYTFTTERRNIDA